MEFAKALDVSKYQKNKVDFKQAYAEGVRRVIIRIGYGITKDPYFEEHYEAAKDAGMLVSAYYYTIGEHISDGEEEAKRVYVWLDGKKLDTVYYDLEDSRQHELSPDLVKAMYQTFKKTLEGLGYPVGLYSYDFFLRNYITDGCVLAEWVANYSKKPDANKFPNMKMWQYTSGEYKGKAYKGNLDVSICYDYLLEAIRYPRPTRILKKKLVLMRGGDVKWVQYHLNRKGYQLVIDGIFGKETDRAVRDYQNVSGLDVDGVVGKLTCSALEV